MGREDGLPADDFPVLGPRLVGHDYNTAMPLHRIGQRLILNRITQRLEVDIEHHQRTAIRFQPIQ